MTVEIELEGDLLDRSRDAQYLTNFALGRSNSTDSSLVINVNAKWGYGKTFLLKNWHVALEDKGYCSLYFDAWKNDYSDDPLLSFISELSEQLQKYVVEKPESKKILKSAISIGARLAKGTLPLVRDIAVKQLTGKATDVISGYFEDESGVELTDEQEAEIGTAVEKLTKGLAAEYLESFKVKKSSVDLFTNTLGSFVGELKGTVSESKIFIFVDELDRCRPSFAVSLLESIKHLFDIKDVVFVVATNTEQLAYSIGAVYGVGFDSRSYLRRFFDIEYVLSAPETKPFVTAKFDELDLNRFDYFLPARAENITDLVAVVVKCFDLPPREIERVLLVVEVIAENIEHPQETIHALPLFFLAGLFILDKEQFYRLYTLSEKSLISAKIISELSVFQTDHTYRWNERSTSHRSYNMVTHEESLSAVLSTYFRLLKLSEEELSKGYNAKHANTPTGSILRRFAAQANDLQNVVAEGDNSHGIDRYFAMIGQAGHFVTIS